MHRQPVTIHEGYHTIDPDAWVAQRTGDQHPEHTAALDDFLRVDVFAEYHPQMDTAARMQLWCAARGWTLSETSPIHHDNQVLTREVTVVLAADEQRTWWALVQIGTGRPVVYRDITTDDAYWQQAETVDVICPTGHRWTWLGDTEFLDTTSGYTTLASLFGQDRDTPCSRCRDCAAFDNGECDDMCPCDNPNVIYCPVCQQRCRLELAEIATYPQPQS